MPETESDYKKQRKAMKEKLATLGKETDSKVVKQMNEEKKRSNDTDLQARIELTHRVVGESMEMVREGEMTFDESIKDIISVINKI